MKMIISNIDFIVTEHFAMPIRNLFMPPYQMVSEVDIRPGNRVLDFGCGPGYITIPLAEKTGPEGLVYALDIHPLSAKSVKRRARKKNLSNIQTVLSGCSIGLPDNGIDLAVIFDVYHELDNGSDVLLEIHRVLKPDGILYFSDHHMKEHRIVSELTAQGLFTLKEKGKRVYRFVRV